MKDLSENFRYGLLVHRAKYSLNKYGYFAMSKTANENLQTVVFNPYVDDKIETEPMPINADWFAKLKKQITDKNPENYSIECGGELIIQKNQLGIDKKVSVPKNLEQLFSIFGGIKTKYRGQADAAWRLLPSVYRNDNPRRESEYFKSAQLNCPQEFPNGCSTFDALVKMQHFSIPTRLIDVTDSPLVALYFAVQNPDNVGVVYKFDPSTEMTKRYDSVSVSIIASLANFEKELDLKKVEWKIRKEFPTFVMQPEDVIRTLRKSYFVEAKRENARIQLQKGSFIIVGSQIKPKSDSELYERSQKCIELEKVEMNALKIFISPALKKKVKKRLSDLGFGHSDVFPGLSSIAKSVEEMNMDTLQRKKIEELHMRQLQQ